jgi:hypothetical protein
MKQAGSNSLASKGIGETMQLFRNIMAALTAVGASLPW